MSFALLAAIALIVGIAAFLIAERKGRDARAWAFATALFPPALLQLLAMPAHLDPGRYEPQKGGAE